MIDGVNGWGRLALARAGVTTVEQLLELSDEDIAAIKGLGRVSKKEIRLIRQPDET